MDRPPQLPRTPLDVHDVDLESLVLARNDVHPDGDWWFDPRTGDSLYHGLDDDSDLPALVAGVHVVIPRESQPDTDIEEFFTDAEILGVPEATAVELFRISRGKGGARRFRDRIGSTAAAGAWTRYAWAREASRAIGWLRGRELVASAPAEEALDRFAADTGTVDGVTRWHPTPWNRTA